MPQALTLGPVQFDGFEIPEKMPFGGEQMLIIRKLIGGDRDIQAMGPDDSPREWSGRFRGLTAETRARQCDFLRKQGQQLVLAWSSFRYLVVIRRFEGDFHQPYEIPYTLACEVLQDLSNPILPPQLGVDDAISTDVSGATEAALQIDVAEITAAISAVSAATGAVGGFQGASASVVSPVLVALGQAQTVVKGQTDAQNGVVTASGSVAGMVGGKDPVALASGLISQSSAFGQLGSLYQLQALLGRTKVNVMNAGS